MRIFSNFDTKLKNEIFEKWKNELWEKNVLLLSKSKFFRFFRVDLPFVFGLILVVVFVMLFDYWFNKIWAIIAIILWLIFFLVLLYYITKYAIDYHMDFIVFTPKYLLRYDQEWMFKRDIITINTGHIKTVLVKKKWLLNSILNEWDLIFFTEWDDERGEIVLTHISAPEENKLLISKIMEKAIWD